MKVTLVNHSDSLGGASVVTFRLMEALRREGVDARMLVVSKTSDNPHVTQAAPRWRSRLPFLAEHLRIFARNGFSRKTLFKISIATDGLPLADHPLIADADAVVLNWVNQGMLSLGGIADIAARKPVIWTMHDAWPYTGVCHHVCPGRAYIDGCADCPLLGPCAGPRDIAALSSARKQRLYDSAGIHFVAVSSWLGRQAAESRLLHGRPISVINNPIDIDVIPTQPLRSRTELGLPPTGRLIVICAARLDDPFKDLPTAVEAFNSLVDTDAHAVLVGEIRNPRAIDDLRLPHTALGPVYDADRLRDIYAHASAVVSSSTRESFGATLVEGQAAGAVPVGFVHDGRADIITDGLTGYAAAPGLRSLGDALRLALDRPIPADQLRDAARMFSYTAVARKYISLFSK